MLLFIKDCCCHPNPCQNGGTCKNGDCSCKPGCSGKKCEKCGEYMKALMNSLFVSRYCKYYDKTCTMKYAFQCLNLLNWISFRIMHCKGKSGRWKKPRFLWWRLDVQQMQPMYRMLDKNISMLVWRQLHLEQWLDISGINSIFFIEDQDVWQITSKWHCILIFFDSARWQNM